MTKEEVLEKLEEERESAKSKILYGQSRNLSVKRYGWYFNGLDYAIDLAKKLSEPKKVVIPEFIANDIKYHKKYGYTLQGTLGDAFGQGLESDVYYWFYADNGDENFRKYVSAWDNGYEVDKEPKYRVQIKGFEETTNYLNYDVNSKEFFVDTAGLGSGIKIKFTKRWLKDYWSEYDAYNNAGLLEFEEVEDD
ncbi:DUF1642 domain-containing protein [Pediococcus pentosaceus]|uniref:DUF1642 domain-containing protein n=1 Tax=Pediococcus pentosaceus TaxID=1255 RepID=A0ABD7X6N5_PEDPE|nr:DUF1642 domain-containing protein [Pediococcus pentosaceus]WEA57297.1 DUF1642 domain-containing protein [Pediococcus pentosaceus]